jgi:hypothetical protein
MTHYLLRWRNRAGPDWMVVHTMRRRYNRGASCYKDAKRYNKEYPTRHYFVETVYGKDWGAALSGWFGRMVFRIRLWRVQHAIWRVKAR